MKKRIKVESSYGHEWEFKKEKRYSRVWILKDQGGRVVLEDKDLLINLGINAKDGGISFQDFLALNKVYREILGVAFDVVCQSGNFYLRVTSSNKVGAIPLISLKTCDSVGGLYVEPHVGWEGLGNICSLMGWMLSPQLVIPERRVPGGNESVPSWLLAGPIIKNFYLALKRPTKGYIIQKDELSFFRGNVNYEKFITNNLSTGKWFSFPCEYDDLSFNCPHHQYILGIVYTLLKSLERSSMSDPLSYELLEMSYRIIKNLRGITPKIPRLIDIENLAFRGSWRRYKTGFEYACWLLTKKGLGGPDDGEGLAWTIRSDELYELWVGFVLKRWWDMIGGEMRSSVAHSSLLPIDWNIPYEKTMGYLLPDYIAEKEDEVWIFDAKYKNLLIDLLFYKWWELDDYVRESHRGDIHQLLAYTSAFHKKKIVGVLVYPIDYKNCDRELLCYTRIGRFRGESRTVWLVLLPLPMESKKGEGLLNLVDEIILTLNKIRAEVIQ